MSTTEMKQKLHEYIDTAADEQLQAILDLLQNGDTNSLLSVEQRTELDQRMQEVESANTLDYTWEETVAMARKAAAK